MREICKYPDCERQITSSEGEGYCLYHADVDKKGVTIHDFYQQMKQDFLKKNDGNFSGFKFPLPFKFFEGTNPISFDIVFKDCDFGSEEDRDDPHKHFEIRDVTFKTEILFNHCRIFAQTNIQSCGFNRKFEVDTSHFHNHFFLYKSIFREVNITKSDFDNNIELIENTFNLGLSIIDSTLSSHIKVNSNFSNQLKIENSKLIHELHFDQNILACELQFNNSEIHLLSAPNIDFQKLEIKNGTRITNLNLTNCRFHQNVIINDSYLENSNFHGSTFNEAVIVYESSLVNVDLSNCLFENEFLCNKDKFIGDTNFNSSVFQRPVDFNNIEVLRDSKKLPIISEIGMTFYRTLFNGSIFFTNCIISNQLLFSRVQEKSETIFRLTNPTFESGGMIVFENIRFEPFTTYIENIRKKMNNVNPIVLFRYCNLKDVYFTNNDMSNISLHKCVYDEARFYLSKWSAKKEKFAFFKYKRKNFIFEDLYRLGEFKNIDFSKYIKAGELDDYSEIASLYRRFKTSLDGTKDYEQAGWFYFNEFEMKLRATQPAKLSSSKTPKYLLYYFYKLFTGFGEKPLWSFWWLLGSVFMFSFLNFLYGFSLYTGKIINYDLHINHNIQFDSEKIFDFCNAILFTVTKIIPLNYIPSIKNYFLPPDGLGLFLSLANSLVLIFFLTFIFIGLKRLFRRF